MTGKSSWVVISESLDDAGRLCQQTSAMSAGDGVLVNHRVTLVDTLKDNVDVSLVYIPDSMIVDQGDGSFCIESRRYNILEIGDEHYAHL